MSRDLVIFGCGSQALYVADNLLSHGKSMPVAAVDLEGRGSVGGNVTGIPVRWSLDEALTELNPATTLAIVAHGDNALKLRVAAILQAKGFGFFTAVNRMAVISPLAKLGAGCIINAGAMVMPNAVVKDHVIVHGGAIVEHDCVVGDGSNIAPGVSIAGRVQLGRGVYLYTGCVLAPNLKIGDMAVVGAGAVVLKDVAPGRRVAGNPARAI